MIIRANQRREIFAQELAKGSTAIAAYKTAGYKPDRSAAARMSTKVRSRVRELITAAAAKTGVTIEAIAGQLDEDRTFAREVKQAGAAVSATMGKAKLYGLLNEEAPPSSLTINGNVTLARIERVIVRPTHPDG